MLTLSQIKQNPHIISFIKQTEIFLQGLSYTDHGFRHSNLVADRARTIALNISLNKKDGELAAIAGFCHDMGNFLGRSYHNYLGAMLFFQIFKNDFPPADLSKIIQAISNHDERIKEIAFSSPIAAVVVLADKSDVHRSRVDVKDIEKIKSDIHDRVNYATKESKIKVDKIKKRITLVLKIDTRFVPIMEYFEIFTDRMIFCRKAAECLGFDFGLVINNFKLL